MSNKFNSLAKKVFGIAALAMAGCAGFSSPLSAQALPLTEQCHRALTENQNEEITRALTALNSKDQKAIVAASKLLSEACENRAVAPLITLLSDQDAVVRVAAIEALGKLGDRSALENLMSLTDDPDWRVRLALGQALCAFQLDSASFTALNSIAVKGQATTADEMRVRAATIIAIHQLRNVSYSRKALIVLLNYAESENPEVKQIAIETIRSLKDTRNGSFELPGLLKQVGNPIPRRRAAYWIGEIGLERAHDLLADVAANDPDAEVRKIAAASVIKLEKLSKNQ